MGSTLGSNKFADSDSLPELTNTSTFNGREDASSNSITGTVQMVYHDRMLRSMGDIRAAITIGDMSKTVIDAEPLSRHNFTCPLPNEKVHLIQDQDNSKWYYTGALSNEGNITHMSNGGLDQIAWQQGESKKIFTGYYFAPDPDAARTMDVYEGDTVIQGRQGSTIRLGQSVTGHEGQPWKTTASGRQSPIMILRTGVLPVENLTYDYSSIYLTSDQNIEIPLPTKLPTAISDEKYVASQIIMLSDRIVLATKVDDILLSSNNTIQLATKDWHHDVDVVLDNIHSLITEVKKIGDLVKQISTTSATETYPVPGVGTSLPSTQATKYATYTSKLSTALTNIDTITNNIEALKQK